MDGGNSSRNSNAEQGVNENRFPIEAPEHLQEELQRILFNMSLAHEIALDYNFHFTGTAEIPKDSLLNFVWESVHNTYWNILENELRQDPPQLEKTLLLLNDIKESLYAVVLPHQTKLKKEIGDIIDIDLIKQQAEHGVLDFKGYVKYIISLMAKICAPVRDSEIKALSEVDELIPALRGIIETLNKMKLDMINFKLNTVKPDVLANSVNYEKEKFTQYLELKGGGLPYTKLWLSSHKPQNPLDAREVSMALNNAFLDLLVWESGKPIPETWILDYQRFVKLQETYFKIVTIVTLFLVILSSIGPELCNNGEFKIELKKKITLLLDGVKTGGSLTQVLPNLVEEVIKDANAKLQEMAHPPLTESTVQLLRSQMTTVTDPQHTIRTLVQKRVGDFLTYTLTTQPGEFSVPPALQILKEELMHFARVYQHTVTYNMKVFHQYYNDIIVGV